MNVSREISKYRLEINKNLLKIYSIGPKSLVKPIQYVLSGEGKRLRPLLTILTTEACGGLKKDAFNSAMAVEILHNFTLVHDDIMDGDNLRHGQPTVHNKNNLIKIICTKHKHVLLSLLRHKEGF